MPKAGEQIGPYTLVNQLGRGAFGVVWLAERRGAFATTQVAMKLTLDDEPDLTAIEQESQLWAKLGGHPNVLPIIEAERYDEYVVIVSEYAPDGSLEGWLRKHGGRAASIESAIAMTTGILSGLEHLHNRKIIHRDLKPANILLQGEMPRLADFGLARVLKSSAKSTGIAGTPSYMAPEVFSGERFVESDLWSVGVILYQMLSGRLPFPQSDIMALIGAIANRNPEPLPSYVSTQLAEIIAHALQKNIPNRFHSALEMRTALQNITSIGTLAPIAILKHEDDKPTVVLSTAEKTDDEKTLATIPSIGINQNTNSSDPFANKTNEQVPNLATQLNSGGALPATEKVLNISKGNLEVTSDKTKSIRKYKSVLVGLMFSMMAGGVCGMWAMGLPPFKKHTSSVYTSSVQAPDSPPATVVSSPDSEDKGSEVAVEIAVNEEVVKENEGLLKEIDKKSSSLDEQIEDLPKGEEQKTLRKVFDEMNENFQTESSKENSLEQLTLIYKRYILSLDMIAKNIDLLRNISKAKNTKPVTMVNEKSASPVMPEPPAEIVPKPPIPKGAKQFAFENMPIPNVNINNKLTPGQIKELQQWAKKLGYNYELKNVDLAYWIKLSKQMKVLQELEEQKKIKEFQKKQQLNKAQDKAQDQPQADDNN